MIGVIGLSVQHPFEVSIFYPDTGIKTSHQLISLDQIGEEDRAASCLLFVLVIITVVSISLRAGPGVHLWFMHMCM